MLKRLIAGALVALAALSSHATAQSWKQLQWGLNTADSPYQVGVNLSGSWYRFATVTPGGAFSLSDVSIPASSITSGTLAAARLPAFSGDVTTPLGSSATTLATVNGNVGSFGSTTQTPQVTVDAKGRVTAVANVTVTPAVGSITGLGSGVASALGNAAGAALVWRERADCLCTRQAMRLIWPEMRPASTRICAAFRAVIRLTTGASGMFISAWAGVKTAFVSRMVAGAFGMRLARIEDRDQSKGGG